MDGLCVKCVYMYKNVIIVEGSNLECLHLFVAAQNIVCLKIQLYNPYFNPTFITSPLKYQYSNNY